MINDKQAPTGRSAGALGWGGLANLFYCIDRKNGIGGFWGTQILPFADPVSFTGYMDLRWPRTTAWHLRRPRSRFGQSGVRLRAKQSNRHSCFTVSTVQPVLQAKAEVMARAANPHDAACTRRVSAAGPALTAGQVVT
jgi:hypothetical protein